MGNLDLNRLKEKAYKCACEHGFHDTEYSDEHCLMLTICEIGEAVEADRKNRHADSSMFNHQGFEPESDASVFMEIFEKSVKDTVEDELADIVIRLLDFAGMKNISLDKGVLLPLGAEMMKDCVNGKVTSLPELGFTTCKILSCYSDLEPESVVYGVLLLILFYCKMNDIDLTWHIDQKMRYNELRPHKNGKEY